MISHIGRRCFIYMVPNGHNSSELLFLTIPKLLMLTFDGPAVSGHLGFITKSKYVHTYVFRSEHVSYVHKHMYVRS